jgi:hypothetical protein
LDWNLAASFSSVFERRRFFDNRTPPRVSGLFAMPLIGKTALITFWQFMWLKRASNSWILSRQIFQARVNLTYSGVQRQRIDSPKFGYLPPVYARCAREGFMGYL